MIILKNGAKELDLSKIPGLGVFWDHEDNVISFENPTLKIPGGNTLALRSGHTINDISVDLITNIWEMDILKGMTRQISDFCLDPLGVPLVVELYKSYDTGFRRVKLKDIKTNFAIKDPKITVTFTPQDPYLYGPMITKTIENATLTGSSATSVSFTKKQTIGSYVKIVATGMDATSVQIRAYDQFADEYSIFVGDVKGDLTFNNETFELIGPAGHIFTRIPEYFRYYIRLSIFGAGTVENVTIQYREVSII